MPTMNKDSKKETKVFDITKKVVVYGTGKYITMPVDTAISVTPMLANKLIAKGAVTKEQAKK